MQTHQTIGDVDLIISRSGCKIECAKSGMDLLSKPNEAAAKMYSKSNRTQFTFVKKSWPGRAVDVLTMRSGLDVEKFRPVVDRTPQDVLGLKAYLVRLSPPDRRTLNSQSNSSHCPKIGAVECVMCDQIEVPEDTLNLLLKYYCLPRQLKNLPLSVKYIDAARVHGGSKQALRTVSAKKEIIDPAKVFELPKNLKAVKSESTLLSSESDIQELLK
ncbi:MAG: hypothetical protein JSS83_12155 [Cyanobacteria bacterium SZAS LIN-3]|nr:hypothetical protein [Cyanobacteria bacterium SZAS LIN-3]